MSSKIPPERDKSPTQIAPKNASTVLEPKAIGITPIAESNETDSLIQMNSSTTQATTNLKNIMQGKWIDEKRETSYGKRKRELMEKLDKLMKENKSKRIELERVNKKRKVVWADQPNTRSQSDNIQRDRQSHTYTDSVERPQARAVLPPPPTDSPVAKPVVDLPKNL